MIEKVTDWYSFFSLSPEERAENARHMENPPKGTADAVLDTDTYNEVDDQFALAYLLKSSDRVRTRAIYAAPFYNQKSDSPKDGMEKSFCEIGRVLDVMGLSQEYGAKVFKGSDRFLENESEPVDSPAARHLAELAMQYTPESPLYVIAIGAITNVASAILMQPEIARRIVIVWLGGNAHHWPHNREFNAYQDVAAMRIVFGCGARFVQLPAMGVVSAFTISGVELEKYLKGHNRLCDYLLETVFHEMEDPQHTGLWTRVIWDVTAVAWLLDEGFMLACPVSAPIPQYDNTYAFDSSRHTMTCVFQVNRDSIYRDLFRKLTQD